MGRPGYRCAAPPRKRIRRCRKPPSAPAARAPRGSARDGVAGWIWTTPGFDDKIRLAVLAYESSLAADGLHARAAELAPSTAERQWELELADLDELADGVENESRARAPAWRRRGAARSPARRLRRAPRRDRRSHRRPDRRASCAHSRSRRQTASRCAARPRTCPLPPTRRRRRASWPSRPRATAASTSRARRLPRARHGRDARRGRPPPALHERVRRDRGGRGARVARSRTRASCPGPMRRDLFRQLWDEARHAETSWRRMDELGGAAGSPPPGPAGDPRRDGRDRRPDRAAARAAARDRGPRRRTAPPARLDRRARPRRPRQPRASTSTSSPTSASTSATPSGSPRSSATTPSASRASRSCRRAARRSSRRSSHAGSTRRRAWSR